MPVPSYGAAPLAKTFLLLRAFQLLSFLIIIGITANFVSEIVNNHYVVAKEIVGTLTVTCIVALYTLLTIPVFYAQAQMTLLIMLAFDFLFLIAFVVVAVVLGKPISYLDCAAISHQDSSVDAASAFAFTQSVGTNIKNKGSDWFVWSGATKTNCYEGKAVWGVSIGLCILFACTVLLLPALFAKQKRAMKNAALPGPYGMPY